MDIGRELLFGKSKEQDQQKEHRQPVQDGGFIDSGNQAMINWRTVLFPQIQQEYTKARILEKLITKDITDIARNNGSKMVGLEYSAKTASSVEDKLKRLQKQQNIKPEQGIKKLNDMVRYTQICKHEDIFPTAKDTIKELEKNGYKLMAINNYYEHPYPNTGYKGLHMNFISPYGQVMELQVHSQESFDIKQQGHDLYEKIRAVATPVEEKERLAKEIKEIHGQVKNPPEYDSLKNYQMDQEERKDMIEERRGKVDFSVQETTEEDICTLMYKFSTPNDQTISGFEVHQSDGSVLSGMRKSEEEAYISSYTKDGMPAFARGVRDYDLIIEDEKTLQDVGKINEILSDMWPGRKNEGISKYFTENVQSPETIITGLKTGAQDVTRLVGVFDRTNEIRKMINATDMTPEEVKQLMTSSKEDMEQKIRDRNKMSIVEEDYDDREIS